MNNFQHEEKLVKLIQKKNQEIQNEFKKEINEEYIQQQLKEKSKFLDVNGKIVENYETKFIPGISDTNAKYLKKQMFENYNYFNTNQNKINYHNSINRDISSLDITSKINKKNKKIYNFKENKNKIEQISEKLHNLNPLQQNYYWKKKNNCWNTI